MCGPIQSVRAARGRRLPEGPETALNIPQRAHNDQNNWLEHSDPGQHRGIFMRLTFIGTRQVEPGLITDGALKRLISRTQPNLICVV